MTDAKQEQILSQLGVGKNNTKEFYLCSKKARKEGEFSI